MEINLRKPDGLPRSQPESPVGGVPSTPSVGAKPPKTDTAAPEHPDPLDDGPRGGPTEFPEAMPWRPLRPLPEPLPEAPSTKEGNRYMRRLFLGCAAAFFGFYCLADYTSVSAGQIHPGELIYSNTMIQLWTAAYRLVFIIAIVLAIIALLSAKKRGLWQYVKPTPDDPGFDLAYSIRYHLTPVQRVWLFYGVFAFLCYLFVLLLTAKLPESVSVTP